MGDSQPESEPGSGVRFFSSANTAKIGRFTIPFPFSAILGILAMPALLVAAALSVPYSIVRGYVVARREEQFETHLRALGRTVHWEEAILEVTRGRGSFIVEYLSLKGPIRLWFTTDNLKEISPEPCCFDEFPWFEESHEGFFTWCRTRCTDLEHGNAKLVDIGKVDRSTLRASLETCRRQQRCVSCGHLRNRRS